MISALYSLPVAGILYAVQSSNLPGKVIVAVLFVGSVFVWSIMITKMRELSAAEKESRSFLASYREAKHPLWLFLEREERRHCPPLYVYKRTCQDLARFLAGGDDEDVDVLSRDRRSVSRGEFGQQHIGVIRSVAERAVAEQVLRFEESMGLLATATTTAPFLGLLGTVWGVMDSFGGMAVTGSAMLSAVAPGISGALLTTVVGLLVALPSAIGYNTLSDKIRQLTVQTDNFSQELVADIERHYVHEGGTAWHDGHR